MSHSSVSCSVFGLEGALDPFSKIHLKRLVSCIFPFLTEGETEVATEAATEHATDEKNDSVFRIWQVIVLVLGLWLSGSGLVIAAYSSVACAGCRLRRLGSVTCCA